MNWDRHAELFENMSGMLNKAQADNRGLTAVERAAYDLWESEMNALNSDRSGYSTPPRSAAGIEAWGQRSSGPRSDANPLDGGSYRPRTAKSGWVDARTGEPVHVLSPEQSVADVVGGDRSLRAGEAICGLISGDWRHRTREQAALSGSSATAGGVLLPTEMAARVIDLARAQAVVFKSGAQTMIMTAPEVLLARQLTDVTARWRQEGTTVTASQPSFGQLRFVAKTLAALCPLTIELAQDAPNIGQVVENSIAKSLALAIDLAVFEGIGAAAQPTGIASLPDVQTITAVGQPDFDDAFTALYKLHNNNFEPTAWVLHPRDEYTYNRKKDGEGNYLTMPDRLKFLPRYTTTAIATTLSGGAESRMFIGDFTKVIVGVRSQLQIEVLRAGTGTDDAGATFNATSQLGMWVRGYMRCDINYERDEAFCALTGVTT